MKKKCNTCAYLSGSTPNAYHLYESQYLICTVCIGLLVPVSGVLRLC